MTHSALPGSAGSSRSQNLTPNLSQEPEPSPNPDLSRESGNQSKQATAVLSHLGNSSIVGLYLKMALPMAFAMMLSGLYNLVDSYFILQHVGNHALGGVALAFPLQMSLFATASMLSSGTAAMVSRLLGAADEHQAGGVAACGLTLALVFGLGFSLLLLPQLTALLEGMGADPRLAPYAIQYLTPILWGAVPVFVLSLCGDLLRARGNVNIMLLVILGGAVGNLLFDYLFIAVLEFGVAGAAWATVLCQCMSLLFGLSYLTGSRSLPLALGRRYLKPEWMKEIVALGSPVFLSYLGVALVIGLTNFMLAQSSLPGSAEVISAYGLLGRFNIFIALPLIALTNAAQTITGFNHGAGSGNRVLQSARLGILLACGYLSLVAATMLLMPERLLGIFSSDPELIRQGAGIAAISFLCLPLAGVSSMAIAVFQGMGRASLALGLSLLKIYGCLLPLLLLLPLWLGIGRIWYAFPIAESLAFIVTVTLLLLRTSVLQIRQSSGMKPGCATP